MKTEFRVTQTFEREFKRLKKKYISLPGDLASFQEEYLKNPNAGVDLGGGFKKIRISVKSKGKGKSGGARIITYEVIISIRIKTVYLVTIFVKSEQESISNEKIREILSKEGLA
jgi:hypothetical protein